MSTQTLRSTLLLRRENDDMVHDVVVDIPLFADSLASWVIEAMPKRMLGYKAEDVRAAIIKVLTEVWR